MKTKMLILLALLGLMTACNSGQEENPGTDAQKAVPVKTTKATQESYTPVLELAGTVFAQKEANLGAALPGRVEKTFYDEGAYVQKGDLLVKMSGELLAQTLAEYNALKKDLARLTRLKKKGSVSQQDYDHLKARFEATEAEMEMMKKNTEIRAPFAGTIVSYQVQEGENYLFAPKLKQGYSNTSGIVSLMQLSRLKVQVDIHEKDLRHVTHGMTASVRLDAYPNDTLTGTVVHVSPSLSTSTRTAATELQIANPGGKIKPGMYATVSLHLREQQGVFVPLSAIYRLPGTGKDFVFVVQPDNTVQRVAIERGTTRGEKVAINNIKPGDEIVITGKNKLANGTKISK